MKIVIFVSPQNRPAIKFMQAHSSIPAAVGSANPSAVHLRLPVSFFIVMQVVAQGK